MLRFLLTSLVMLTLALGLSACGRKGPLEPPPSAATEQPGESEQPPVPKPDKPFILDGLLS